LILPGRREDDLAGLDDDDGIGQVAESISRRAVLYPTEVTWTPRLRNSRCTTGVGEWVAAQTMLASAHTSE